MRPHKKKDIFTLNFDYRRLMSNGCQFIAMNFQEIASSSMFFKSPKTFIENYVMEFSHTPIKIKPSYLRYIPKEKPPTNVYLPIQRDDVVIPNLYKIDFDIFTNNKVYRIQSFNNKYLSASSSSSQVRFADMNSDIGMDKSQYNFMIFPNHDYSQSIMISPANGKVPINYLNRKIK